MKIVIIGAGNLGSIFSGYLTRAGHLVTLVARGKRLEVVRKNGIYLKRQSRDQVEHFNVNVEPELTKDMQADLILVTVQRHQVDDLMPALKANSCPRICFMFNCGEDDSEWQRQLRGRLFWAFPAILARMSNEVIEYVIFPPCLRFLQITTVGITPGGNLPAAKETNKLFNDAGIETVFHNDMRSWLFTHMSLMLPALALAVIRLKEGKPVKISYKDACLVAEALKEGFNVTSSAGYTITPRNVKLLNSSPSWMVAPVLWTGAQIKLLQKALAGLPDNSYHEVTMMYQDLKRMADRHQVSTPILDQLCVGLGH